MFNYYERAKALPEIYTQLRCREMLFVHYDCPLQTRIQDKWSQHNHILYILTGKKSYHTHQHSWTLGGGDAVFVKKGASIVEKFFDEPLCIMTFFIPDSYLRSFMREQPGYMRHKIGTPGNDLLIPLRVNDLMTAYFSSMIPYFRAEAKPSEEMLELKFKELLMNILNDPDNNSLIDYLQLMARQQHETLQSIMEANCLFNLTLDDYARLTNMSVSSFKRHFYAVYKERPGHWLMQKKLEHAYKLLLTSEKPVTEIAFESGFEDSTHFSHVFKKQFGTSPLKYRGLFNRAADY